ncbi:LysR substrate-binding domain-containing protein [Rhizobium sp. LjRoot98]|uniref:LysR substrate-binding domain-containing protein n=1 Tax=Rhizobium sp. LjRoot98 TaxID=3342345 RepID=UPI003F503AD4
MGFVASTLYGGLPSLVRKLRQHAPELDIQLLEMVSVQQIPALKEGRIDIGFGRLRHSDPNVTGIVLREERLVVAIPKGTPLAESNAPLPIVALADRKIIVYPKEPRPSYADQVLSLLQGHDARPAEVHEVREIETALGLVAADAGLCLIPASARQMRSDVHYRPLAGDTSPYIDLVKKLIQEMYAENPPWLDTEHNYIP